MVTLQQCSKSVKRCEGCLGGLYNTTGMLFKLVIHHVACRGFCIQQEWRPGVCQAYTTLYTNPLGNIH